jgi:uncharacterized membrane protein YsdA (DUF1294 family)
MKAKGLSDLRSVAFPALFLASMLGAVLAGRLPSMVFVLYLGASLVAFIAYARDKSAARKDQWRIAETTLHWVALAGGWPGALIAQKLLRHKSRKRSFQTVFRTTVVLNCGALLTYFHAALTAAH